MKILHVYKTEPDDVTRILVEKLSEGENVTEFELFKGNPDYELLLDLVFDHDTVITWW